VAVIDPNRSVARCRNGSEAAGPDRQLSTYNGLSIRAAICHTYTSSPYDHKEFPCSASSSFRYSSWLSWH
jgi:hypothetical protein